MSSQSIGNSLTDLVVPMVAIAVAFTCAQPATQQQPKPLPRKKVPTGSLAGGLPKIENRSKRVSTGSSNALICRHSRNSTSRASRCCRRNCPAAGNGDVRSRSKLERFCVARRIYAVAQRWLECSDSAAWNVMSGGISVFVPGFKAGYQTSDGRLATNEIEGIRGRRL